MSLPAEVLLMAIAIGLYLYDSAIMLYINEGILTPRGRGWSVGFGSNKARLKGMEVFLPHPLLPHRPLFRLAWQFQCNAKEADGNWTTRSALFGPLVPMVWGMALAVFVLLPLGLFSRLGERMLLAAIVLLYLCIVAALLWLGFNRTRFGLSGRRFAGLAFESLLCSPFALNLIRKISAAMPVEEDLVNAARRLQRPGDWNATRIEFIARLDEEIEDEDQDSGRAAVLKDYRQKLIDEQTACLR